MSYTKEHLESLVICDIIDKKDQGFSDHCFYHCNHSKFHVKNDCSSEFCNLHKTQDTIKVKCIQIKKKEIKVLLDKISKGEDIKQWIILND